MLSGHLIYFAVIFSIVAADTNNSTTKIIETPNGNVRGYLEESRLTGKKYFAFRGIPFGKPPIGDLRFKAPEPAGPWKPEIIDGLEYAHDCICHTEMVLDYVVNRSENCLFLNIFIPDVKDNKKLGVYFNIHGGGFWEGSNYDALGGPDFLIEHDIIVVTHNYRLGIFGFLQLYTPEYSGNMGLKDTQLAMKWTHENIEFFGGDPSTITIGGHSSGAIAAHLQMYNAESRKYFERIICLSGVAEFTPEYDKDRGLKRAYAIAESMSHPAKNVDELIAFLKQVPAEELRKVSEPPFFWNQTILWWPILPESEDTIRPIVTQDINMHIYDTLTDLNVSALFTFTSAESLCLFPPEVLANETLKTYQGNLVFTMPVYEETLPYDAEPYRKSLEKVCHQYFDNLTTFYDRENAYIRVTSDFKSIYPVETTVKKHAATSKGDTFYWTFAIDSKLNYMKRFVDSPLPGTCHADDLCYLFWCHPLENDYKNVIETRKSDKDSELAYQTIITFTKLISNFIKYGDPAFKGDPISGYKPVKGDQLNCLNIGNDGLSVGVNPNGDKMKFVEEILLEAEQKMDEYFNSSIPSTTEIKL